LEITETKKKWAITVKNNNRFAGRTYVWYTQISIADGPYKFMVYRV
jgi:hypothetical protein